MLRMDSGRYANLFAPGTFAVWVSDEVALAKYEREVASGTTIDSALLSDAQFITGNYYVIEVHLESFFPDASIAYDVVGLRNMDTYLELPDGQRVAPIQRVLGAGARESQRGTLKQFGRTNILVFPRQEVFLGEEAIPATASAVRLVIDGFHSTYYFQWVSSGRVLPDGTLAAAREVTAEQAGRMSFSQMYGRLRDLARHFQ